MLERIADGRTDLVFDCLSDGREPGAEINGVSLIKWCAYYGDVSAIRYLLGQGESLGSLGENFDLNGAAFHGHWQLVQFLLEQKADVNYPLPDTGETPLHSATAKAGNPRYDHVVRVLLAHGADPNQVTKPGVPTGAFMRDARTKGETSLHRAAAFGTDAAVRMLIDAGANVRSKDINGDTPLAWASWHLRPAAILRLLAYGEHTVSETHVAHYTGDHGSGFSGMDRSLLGKPHC